MGEPTEMLYLDPTKKQDITKAQGAMALEYEPTIVCFIILTNNQSNQSTPVCLNLLLKIQNPANWLLSVSLIITEGDVSKTVEA